MAGGTGKTKVSDIRTLVHAASPMVLIRRNLPEEKYRQGANNTKK